MFHQFNSRPVFDPYLTARLGLELKLPKCAYHCQDNFQPAFYSTQNFNDKIS